MSPGRRPRPNLVSTGHNTPTAKITNPSTIKKREMSMAASGKTWGHVHIRSRAPEHRPKAAALIRHVNDLIAAAKRSSIAGTNREIHREIVQVFRHARPCAGHPRLSFLDLAQRRGWPGQARP